MASIHRRLTLGLVILVAACGTDSEAGEEFAAEPPAEAAPARESTPSAGASSDPLAVSDLDAYERGVEAEIAAVGEAERRRADATQAEDSLAALTDATELRTLEVGARAAGLALDRYREVRRRVDEILRVNAPSPASQVMATVDTTNAPPEVRARVRETLQTQQATAEDAREAAFTSLDPQVATELRTRMDRLDSLRIRLIAERVRVAEGR